MELRTAALGHELRAHGAIYMDQRRIARLKELARLRAHTHELVGEFREVCAAVAVVGKNACRIRTPGFSELNLLIDLGHHVFSTGIGEDAAIAQRARSEFHFALEPTNNLTLGY